MWLVTLCYLARRGPAAAALIGLAVLALAGCAPLTAEPARGPAGGPEGPTTAREPDCARQFDDNDAGFQLCRRGARPGSE